jgi:hypothetical protein
MRFKIFLESSSTKALEQAVTTVLDPSLDPTEYSLVKVNMNKLAKMTHIMTSGNEMTRIADPKFATKFDRFSHFAETTNEKIIAPYQVGSKMSENSIMIEGNHRLAYFFEKGAKIIQIAIRTNELHVAKKIGLVT